MSWLMYSFHLIGNDLANLLSGLDEMPVSEMRMARRRAVTPTPRERPVDFRLA